MLANDPTIRHWRTADTAASYDYAFGIQPWERTTGDHRTTINTRAWQRLVIDETRQQRKEQSVPMAGERLGARIIYRLPKLVGDLDNYCKTVFDAMQELAFNNDSAIDYIECVRLAYTGKPLIEVELLSN